MTSSLIPSFSLLLYCSPPFQPCFDFISLSEFCFNEVGLFVDWNLVCCCWSHRWLFSAMQQIDHARTRCVSCQLPRFSFPPKLFIAPSLCCADSFFFIFPISLKKHPINCIVLSIFTLSISFAVGRIVLEAAILTAVMVFGLMIYRFYTFWAVKRGHDFSFLGPFLFGALLIILVFTLLQLFYPLGKLSSMIFSGIASIVFCGYIIFDTNQLIKKLNYDKYILATISLYLDVINLFLDPLNIMSNAQ